MRHSVKMALAALIVAAPAQARGSEWWLVGGGPGADALTLADGGSITKSGSVRTVKVAEYWRNGRSVMRTASIRCGLGRKTALDRFVCGDDAYRMRAAMLLGETTPDRFAQMVFSVDPLQGSAVTLAAN